jgi:isoleucyl-tRNA synthetase
VLKRFENDLRYLFIVSAVEIKKGLGNGDSPVVVEVGKAPGQKCERCWNFSIHVGEDTKVPTVCERCSAVLKEIGGA